MVSEGVRDVLNGGGRVTGRVLAVHDVVGSAATKAVPRDVAQVLLGADALEDLDIALSDERENPSLEVGRMCEDELLEDADAADSGRPPDGADAVPADD